MPKESLNDIINTAGSPTPKWLSSNKEGNLASAILGKGSKNSSVSNKDIQNAIAVMLAEADRRGISVPQGGGRRKRKSTTRKSKSSKRKSSKRKSSKKQSGGKHHQRRPHKSKSKSHKHKSYKKESGGKRKRSSQKHSKKSSKKGSKRKSSKKMSGGKRKRSSQKHSKKGSKKGSKRRSSKKMSGGKRKRSSQKHSKKGSKKGSKRHSRKKSLEGGKRRSHKKLDKSEETDKPKKHSKKRRSVSRELSPGMKAHQGLVKFIQSEMKIKGGPAVQQLAKIYKDDARKKNPSQTDSVVIAKEAEKLFLADKAKGGPQKKYEEILSKAKTRKSSKKAEKKTE